MAFPALLRSSCRVKKANIKMGMTIRSALRRTLCSSSALQEMVEPVSEVAYCATAVSAFFSISATGEFTDFQGP